jgi:uncharacterized protein (TIGR02246 family)
MRHLSSVITVFLCFAVLLSAQEQNWETFDSSTSKLASANSDTQLIYEVLLKEIDRWNAHDIEGYLEVFWKSPELLVVIDSEQHNGWQELHDSYVKGYSDRNSMGWVTPARIQVRMVDPNVASALTWWGISYQNSKQKVVGNTTALLKKFEDGWKIISSHSSTAEE